MFRFDSNFSDIALSCGHACLCRTGVHFVSVCEIFAVKLVISLSLEFECPES